MNRNHWHRGVEQQWTIKMWWWRDKSPVIWSSSVTATWPFWRQQDSQIKPRNASRNQWAIRARCSEEICSWKLDWRNAGAQMKWVIIAWLLSHRAERFLADGELWSCGHVCSDGSGGTGGTVNDVWNLVSCGKMCDLSRASGELKGWFQSVDSHLTTYRD